MGAVGGDDIDFTLGTLDRNFLAGTPFQGYLFALDHPGQNQDGSSNPLAVVPGAARCHPGCPVASVPAPDPPGGFTGKEPLTGLLGGSR